MHTHTHTHAHEYPSEETFLIAYCTNELLMYEASILGIVLELGRGKLQRTVTSSPQAGLTVAQREHTLKSYRITELADLWACPPLNMYGIQPSSSL